MVVNEGKENQKLICDLDVDNGSEHECESNNDDEFEDDDEFKDDNGDLSDCDDDNYDNDNDELDEHDSDELDEHNDDDGHYVENNIKHSTCPVG